MPLVQVHRKAPNPCGDFVQWEAVLRVPDGGCQDRLEFEIAEPLAHRLPAGDYAGDGDRMDASAGHSVVPKLAQVPGMSVSSPG